LQYLGFTTAAATARPAAAFTLRLGVVMLVAGTVAASMRLTGALASYGSTVIALAIVAGLVAATGLGFYRAPIAAAPGDATATSGRPPARGVGGLVTLLIFFMGQTGFLAYAIQSASQRSLPLADTTIALAAMKIVVGAWLIHLARKAKMPRSRSMVAAGAALALGVVAIAAAQHLVMFFVGLLVFEIAFNSLSVALQAKIVEAAPELGRSWLTAAVMVGAALGPPLNGGMIALGMDAHFIAFAMLSALTPGLWVWRQRAAGGVSSARPERGRLAQARPASAGRHGQD
jgi:hypothetical protein